VSWAAIGAWFGVFAGLAGIAALALTVRARLQAGLPNGTLIGFVLTGLAAIGLSAFLMVWGLGP